jgi:hypothetical protein
VRTLFLSALAAGAFLSFTLGGAHDAQAVVCAKGVYRAGCAGPAGAAVVRRPAAVVAPRAGAVCRRYGLVGGVRRCVLY